MPLTRLEYFISPLQSPSEQFFGLKYIHSCKNIYELYESSKDKFERDILTSTEMFTIQLYEKSKNMENNSIGFSHFCVC